MQERIFNPQAEKAIGKIYNTLTDHFYNLLRKTNSVGKAALEIEKVGKLILKNNPQNKELIVEGYNRFIRTLNIISDKYDKFKRGL